MRLRTRIEERGGERVDLEEYPFTKVRVSRRNGALVRRERSVGFTGWIGGVAVLNRPLSPKQKRRLAGIGRPPITAPAR